VTNIAEMPWRGRAEDELAWAAYRRALRAAGRSAQTVADYQMTLQLLSRSLPAGTDLWSMTREDIEAWLEQVGARQSRSTLATYGRRVRTFTAWAASAEYRDDDPGRAIVPAKAGERLVPVPDREHVRAVAAAVSADRGFYGRRDWALLCLLCEAGTPRASELAAMPLAALDLRREQLQFTGKGDLERVIGLGAASCRAFTLYLRARAAHRYAGRPELFIGRQGALTRAGVRSTLAGRCRAAGVPPITTHHWRHLTADAWFDAGGDVVDAMKLYGWRTPQMAANYGGAAAARRAVRHSRERSVGDSILAPRV
jgi:integrase/recombinase XerC